METIKLLLEEAALFEMDAYEIYSIFKTLIPKDAKFWEQIANEELGHAGLLKKCLPLSSSETEAAGIISVEDIEIIKDLRKYIKQLMIEFQKNPSPEVARSLALYVESSIVEKSYQKFMESMPTSNLKQIFQLLNGKDKDHIIRINNYYKTNYDVL
jgi:rubrerythrin